MGRMNQASQEGTDRYLDWYDKYPLDKGVVEEMYHGQCKIMNGLIFSENQPGMAEFDVEDLLMNRLRSWLGKKGS